MSPAPLAAVAPPTLADALDEWLAAALAGRPRACPWCGGAHVTVTAADIWSGTVATSCPRCGSELEGTVPRRLREVSR